MFDITIFNAIATTSKFPKSPHEDKTFNFLTNRYKLEEIAKCFSENFILNRKYNFFILSDNIRRTKRDLHNYLSTEIDFIIIDIDKINSKKSLNTILNYFVDKQYTCIIVPSRSHDKLTNFNIKGLIKVKGQNDTNGIKIFLEQLQKNIGDNGKVDLTSASESGFQAPTYQNETLLIQRGSNIPLIEKVASKNYEIDITKSETINKCVLYLDKLGFKPLNENENAITFYHKKENTPGGYFLFKDFPFILNHYNPQKSINFLKEILKEEEAKEYFRLIERKNKEFILEGNNLKYYKKLEVNQKYLKIDDKMIEILTEWEKESGLLKIKSPMGTGKSNVIDYIINKFHKQDKKILFITNRISVANDFKEKYSKYGVKLYSEKKYNSECSVIVQLESLWKYNIKDYDLIIMDEFVSLMLHSRNRLSDFSQTNRLKLFYAMKKKPIVIADAFILGTEDKFMLEHTIFIIDNKYRDNTKLFQYQNINVIAEKIIEKAKDTKISISCNTKITAEALMYVLKNMNKRVVLLDSGTKEEDKTIVYDSFEEDIKEDYEILIYTPTLTVGVSILNDMPIHFHIDEGNTCDVISSIQMLKRNRNAKEIHFYFAEVNRYYIYDENYLIQDFEKEMLKSENKGFMLNIDDYGNIVISEFGKFIFVIEAFFNLLQNNSKFSFLHLMKLQFKSKIKEINDESSFNLNKYKKIIKELQQEKMMNLLNSLKEDKNVINLYDNQDSIKLKKELRFLQEGFSNLSFNELKQLYIMKHKDKNIISKMKLYKMYITEKSSTISKIYYKAISENQISRDTANTLKQMLVLKSKGFVLKDAISKNDINSYDYNPKMLKKFLYMVGYKWKLNNYRISKEFKFYAKKLLRY